MGAVLYLHCLNKFLALQGAFQVTLSLCRDTMGGLFVDMQDANGGFSCVDSLGTLVLGVCYAAVPCYQFNIVAKVVDSGS